MSPLSDHPIGTEARLGQLTGDDADLLGYFMADTTSQGYYYLTLRTWEHPDDPDAWTLSMRYAYLTAGDGGDGWVDEGMNMRVNGPREPFLQALALMCAGAIPRLDQPDADAWTGNVTEE
ncbi:hypothetical protein K745_gp37 [Haloarcula hispanica virus PH1]|uniref:Uncharacterized protein n=1 Tax=Haloarcula hispanica virus PH1 TaxID=1282967 RepID=M4JG82_9VIRU|nr:hypothetical protein K745_gp37 [Haloarcula hispanica virus PH1]AGC65562.1 hypothetical protein HhPH1_gp37 [Haloarcula hispanica virus PH1]